MTPTHFSTASLPPVLIAAAFDRLAHMPPGRTLHLPLLIAMARSIGCDDWMAAVLLVRLRAAALIFCDARWPMWAQVFRASDDDARRALDAGLLSVIAGLPLTDALRFAPDRFFDMRLGVALASGRG